MIKNVFALWSIILVLCMGTAYLPRQSASDDKITVLRLNDCLLPCWLGIIPGKTTVGEARQLIQAAYNKSFDVEPVDIDRDYSWAYVLKVYAKDRSQYLMVSLNDYALEPQDDSSIVHEVMLEANSDINPGKYAPTIGDLMLTLGKPGCLAAQMGGHIAWPTMRYPRYQTTLHFGNGGFQVTPSFTAYLQISDHPLVCSDN